MDGLARVAAGSLTITVDGEVLELSPLQLKDFATIEQKILATRPNLIDQAAAHMDKLSPEMQKHLLDRAISEMSKANKVTPDEMHRYCNTFEGNCLCIWLSLKKKHPELTLERVSNWVERQADAALREIARQRDQLSGTDTLGNSTGPLPAETTAGEQSHGAGTTDTSPSDSAGPSSKSAS